MKGKVCHLKGLCDLYKPFGLSRFQYPALLTKRMLQQKFTPCPGTAGPCRTATSPISFSREQYFYSFAFLDFHLIHSDLHKAREQVVTGDTAQVNVTCISYAKQAPLTNTVFHGQQKNGLWSCSMIKVLRRRGSQIRFTAGASDKWNGSGKSHLHSCALLYPHGSRRTTLSRFLNTALTWHWGVNTKYSDLRDLKKIKHSRGSWKAMQVEACSPQRPVFTPALTRYSTGKLCSFRISALVMWSEAVGLQYTPWLPNKK